MRIVVTSAPKSGNHWLKCLLGRIYDLEWLPGEATPETKPEAFGDWVAAGGFPDGSIFHQHVRFSKELCNVIEATPAHLATIVRDPYDTFVSLHAWVQDLVTHDVQSDKEQRPRPRDIMIGKPLDHPDVLAYLAEQFGTNLSRSNDWLHSGRAVVVHYEDLHNDPESILSAATACIAPTDAARIKRAIDECRADRMRQLNEKMAWHVRSAKVGESKERLSDAHLTIFRERYPDLIRSLGYEVR